MLDGLLLVKEPQHSPHRTAIILVAKALEQGVGDGKATAYARAGIAEYWILNLGDAVLEVYREPAGPSAARRHWAYSRISRLTAEATIAPLAAPAVVIRIADLLP